MGKAGSGGGFHLTAIYHESSKLLLIGWTDTRLVTFNALMSLLTIVPLIDHVLQYSSWIDSECVSVQSFSKGSRIN